MILFTSDLDRTLIYSESMMKKYPINDTVMAIEYKEDEIISFMSQQSMELLKQFHEKNLFVPVTTRAIYQYERIVAFQQWIQPKYAIMSNGGTILIDGKPDAEWSQLIREKITTTSLPKEDMLQLFAEIRNENWVGKEYYIDELFYMFPVNRQCIPYQELKGFEKRILKIGWRMFLHGRKLYVLPIQLNKAFAVTHLKNYVDYDMHIAAGDSLMDYEMLIQAAIGYSPPHGEIFEKQGLDPKVTWLKEHGAASAEELLSHLLAMTMKI
ncbi:HAD family hydrolase [Sporosarcina sp. FSL K6-3457]|uniref:HAD family hydrolase n=1 Tax=Sporosarcina sp. FSL K6-3457 TaxID=2978204 RepID=UPI0030F6C133